MGSRLGSTIARMRGRSRIGLPLAIAVAAIAALIPASALASTVSKSGATLTYTAAAGETNNAVISLAGGVYTIDDSGATVTAGAGCTSVNANRATCPSAGVTSISANAGNMNDLVWNTSATAATITGADGNDSLISGNGADVLIGCVGNDSLTGTGGADILVDGFFNCGGGGNDTFDGGTGADGIFGGDGSDTVTYASRTASVHVNLDGDPNDGEAGEGDDVETDVENVIGGSGADNITGSPAANILRGEGGNDVVVGEVTTGASGGNDAILGGPGADALGGGNGDNQIIGGDGNDVLNSGLGADSIDGGAGADEIRALDGVIDAINCGADFDFGVADEGDVISPSCEEVFRSSYPPIEEFPVTDSEFPIECFADDSFPGSDGGEQGFPSCLSARSTCSSVRILRRPASLNDGAVGIRVKLPKGSSEEGGVCRGKLKLEALPGRARKSETRSPKIGARPFVLRAGQSKRFEIEISRPGRRMIERADRMPVRVGLFAREDGEAYKVSSEVITIESSNR